MPHAVKLIHDCPARVVSVIVDAADVHQIIEAERLLGKSAYLCDALRVVHHKRQLTAKIRRFGKKPFELSAELVGFIQSGHRVGFKFEISNFKWTALTPKSIPLPLFCPSRKPSSSVR